MKHDYDSTRRSWNVATKNHNTHKGDQAAFLRGGGDILFPEEVELLGELTGRKLVHLQCNAGQDSLCLARRGAVVTGVDLSDTAIDFATALARDSGIAAKFVQAEVVTWLHETPERFDLAFASYGATGWLPELEAWAHGVYRVLEPGGRLVYVEFHPLLWCWGKDLRPTGDDYFAQEPFISPVSDYVADSGAALGAIAPGTTIANQIPAYGWQHGFAEVLDCLARAGFVLERVREYPYANGCKLNDALVAGENRRWEWPKGIARTPLMYGIAARRPLPPPGELKLL